MNKITKILLPISGTLLMLVGGYFIWRYITSSEAVSPSNVPASAGETNQQITAPQKPLTASDVFDFWLNKKNGGIYYIAASGKIAKVTLENAPPQTISEQSISSLNFIKPSNDGTRILIAFGLPQKPTFSIFDTAKNSFLPVPQGVIAADWDPGSGDRIAYLKEANGVGQLGTFDLKTGKSSDKLKINQNDLTLNWGLPDVIYLSDRPSSKTGNSTWSYNLKTGSFAIFDSGVGITEIKWWPEKLLGLKSTGDQLTLIDRNNVPTLFIGLKTLPSKCWMGGSFIYCAAVSSADTQKTSLSSLLNGGGPNEKLYTITMFDPEPMTNLPISDQLSSLIGDQKLNIRRIDRTDNQLLFLNQLDHTLYALSL